MFCSNKCETLPLFTSSLAKVPAGAINTSCCKQLDYIKIYNALTAHCNEWQLCRVEFFIRNTLISDAVCMSLFFKNKV